MQDGQHGRGPPEELESAAIGGTGLVVAGVRAEEVAQFIVSPAEPGGRWECQKPGALRRELDCRVAKSPVQHRGPDLKHTMGASR